MILFYCIGLHESGGVTILDFFINNSPCNKFINFFIDKRYSYKYLENKGYFLNPLNA